MRICVRLICHCEEITGMASAEWKNHFKLWREHFFYEYSSCITGITLYFQTFFKVATDEEKHGKKMQRSACNFIIKLKRFFFFFLTLKLLHLWKRRFIYLFLKPSCFRTTEHSIRTSYPQNEIHICFFIHSTVIHLFLSCNINNSFLKLHVQRLIRFFFCQKKHCITGGRDTQAHPT